MHIGAPQGIYLGLVAVSLGIALAKDGQPRTGNNSFFLNLVASCAVVGLLYWGGFFS